MRVILFRGKRENGGGWIYGNAVKKAYHNGYYITTHAYSSDRVNATGLVSGAWEGYEDIIPETVGQYTGLTDKNGKKIFEGDIVSCIYDGVRKPNYEVVYDVDELGFKATNGRENYGINFQYLPCCEEVEVIGNIYDNPELLEVQT